MEIHVTCDPETAQKRDPKGLYKKAADGGLTGLTGFDAAYEAPQNAEIVVDTETMGVSEAVSQLIEFLG